MWTSRASGAVLPRCASAVVSSSSGRACRNRKELSGHMQEGGDHRGARGWLRACRARCCVVPPKRALSCHGTCASKSSVTIRRGDLSWNHKSHRSVYEPAARNARVGADLGSRSGTDRDQMGSTSGSRLVADREQPIGSRPGAADRQQTGSNRA